MAIRLATLMRRSVQTLKLSPALLAGALCTLPIGNAFAGPTSGVHIGVYTPDASVVFDNRNRPTYHHVYSYPRHAVPRGNAYGHYKHQWKHNVHDRRFHDRDRYRHARDHGYARQPHHHSHQALGSGRHGQGGYYRFNGR